MAIYHDQSYVSTGKLADSQTGTKSLSEGGLKSR